MLERFAQWLAGKMLASQAIPREDVSLVSFGIVQGLRTLIEIIIMLITGFVFRLYWQGVVILVVFMPLRIYAGGYHAKTPLQCALKTWLLFLGVLLWLKFVPAYLWVQILLLAGTAVCLWKFAPVQHVNKPLEEYEVLKYRKRAFLIFGAETVFFVVFRVFGFVNLARCIVLGIAMMQIIMMLGVILGEKNNGCQRGARKS